MTRAVFLSILLLFLIGLGPSPGGAVASGAFRAEVTSHSHALIANASHWTSYEMSIGSRSLGREGTPAPMEFAGSAGWLTVHRYETTRLFFGPHGLEGRVGLSPTLHEFHNFTQAKISYESRNRYAAAVVWAERVESTSADAELRITTLASSPQIVGQWDPKYGIHFNPDEEGDWSLRGPHLAFAHEGVVATTTGGLRFYWSLGTVTVHTAEGDLPFESRAWDEPAVPGVGRVRHLVWFDLTSEDAATTFRVREPGSDVNSVGFARELAVNNATSIRLESVTDVAGSLPPLSQRTGPSLWVQGPLDAVMGPRTAEEGSVNGSYKVVVSGEPTAYAMGGGPAIPLRTMAAALAAGGISVLLGAAVVSLWKLAWGLYSKIALPDLANDPTRRAILDRLQGHVLTAADLVRATGQSRSGVRKHLWRLERAGMILRQGTAWRPHYKLATAPAMTPAPRDLRVVDHVLSALAGEPVRFIDLCRAVQARTAVSKVAVWKAVRRLVDQGRVRHERRGRQLWLAR